MRGLFFCSILFLLIGFVACEAAKEDDELLSSELQGEAQNNDTGVPIGERLEAETSSDGSTITQSEGSGTSTAASSDTVSGTIKVFVITATNWAFSPSTITVKKGDTVELILVNQEGDHGISLPDFGVSLKGVEGEEKSVEFVADKVGTFSFRCNVFCGTGHKEMDGILVVEE